MLIQEKRVEDMGYSVRRLAVITVAGLSQNSLQKPVYLIIHNGLVLELKNNRRFETFVNKIWLGLTAQPVLFMQTFWIIPKKINIFLLDKSPKCVKLIK